MDVLKSIWTKLRQFFSGQTVVKPSPIIEAEAFQPELPSAEYALSELVDWEADAQAEVKEATTGSIASTVPKQAHGNTAPPAPEPVPVLRVVKPVRPVDAPSPKLPLVPLEEPPRLRLVKPENQPGNPVPARRKVKPRTLPVLEELVAYGRSRTNLLEQAFITQLLGTDLKAGSLAQAKRQDYTFHMRWVAADTPRSAFERFKEQSLVAQWASLNRQGIADDVIWRFDTNFGAVALPKLDAYREQAGWLELLTVTVQLSAELQPFQHAFLVAYTDDGELLGHPFCNSLSLLPAETRPVTSSHWRQPNMDAEKAQLIEAYLNTRFFDELMADLDDWRQRADEKLRVGLSQAEHQAPLYRPNELISLKNECQQAFLHETETIDAIQERILVHLENCPRPRYKYETLAALRWELI